MVQGKKSFKAHSIHVQNKQSNFHVPGNKGNKNDTGGHKILQQVLSGNKGQHMLSQRSIEFHKATRPHTSFAYAAYDDIKSKYSVDNKAGKFSSTGQDNIKAANVNASSKSDSSGVTLPNPGLFDSSIVAQYIDWNKMTRVGPGFYNNGNSCFLNSTLQCLLHTPALVQVLLAETKPALRGIFGREGNFVSSNFCK